MRLLRTPYQRETVMPDNNTQIGSSSSATPGIVLPGTGTGTGSRDIQLESFTRLESRIRAVPESDLVAINVDGSYAVTVALGSVTRIAALRPRMDVLAGEVDLALIDEVPALAYAFSYATADYVHLTSSAESLPMLAEEGARLRERMLLSKQALDSHGLVQGQYLEGLRGVVGYRNLSHDLSALVRFYRENWSVVAGKTPMTIADIDRASVISGRLLAEVSTKQGTPKEIAESTLVRHQAFTLFVRAYDEARRAVSFLRWKHGDADVIAPSLYGGRTRSRKDDGAEPVSTSESATTNGTQPSAAEPTTSIGNPAAAVGHLGSSPFMSK
jgi:hypothetical protein